MRPFLAITLAALLASTQAQQAPIAAAASSTAVTGKAVLEDATPVRLRIARNVSSHDAHTGETVDFEVLEEVKVGDAIVVPKGGIAWGTVTEAQSKRRMARGGKLDMTIDAVRLLDGQKAALRGVREAKGGGHTGAMTGGIVATALIVWPAAPFFLFMHGKDVTIPKGTEITAYINGNVPIDLAKFVPQAGEFNRSHVASTTAATAAHSQATLEISSTPPGADIELDGSFVGNTPSSIGISSGEHNIKLTKNGYSPWERKLKASTGAVKISPELQPMATVAASQSNTE